MVQGILKKLNKNAIPSEFQEQRWFVKYLIEKEIAHFHIPNGGYRKGKIIKGRYVPLEAINLQRMGVKRGVPDLCIPIPKTQYHGLYIEMKKSNGSWKDVTLEQMHWINFLRSQGYRVEVGFGWINAANYVNDYLGLDVIL